MKVCKTCGNNLHNPLHPLSVRCDNCISRMKKNTGDYRKKGAITSFHGSFSGQPENPRERMAQGKPARPAYRHFPSLFDRDAV